ncbi:hypothetical protein G7Z17_g3568 [Cylindrodendrum hubeiense]|uniref:NAD(P)-binding domain-containing protein n=1 Tax=Cylindrodendrum hubeiense TaxID=595255 RepID=A0A9P5HKX4_9HYPO|nr:hypothetical protein G7Z17_g3568 [Cylindrodendrum hubeiense]
MKVLIVGASGMIGGEILLQCLTHPSISTVVAFVRRELPAAVSENPKLQCVVIKDFSVWPEELLQAHTDAAGMIWAMGSYNGSVTADLEYPSAFQENMAQVLEKNPTGSQFRFVQLSGKFVRQNQEQKLWFLEKPRKIKGLLETKTLEVAKSHAAIWKGFIVKPGGVVAKTIMGNGVVGVMTSMGAAMGENWSVRIDELGAFMTYLAIDGEGEDPLIENARIVRRGRELLKLQKKASESSQS